MVVYADILVILNLIVDYFLLSASAAILRIKLPFWRQLAGASVGAVSSLYIFAPEIHRQGNKRKPFLLNLAEKP